MKKTLFLLFALAALSGCMTDNEAWLRNRDMDIKAAHPATYQPVVLTGPLELKEGASIVSTTPSQPYVPTDIPNGAAIQAGVAGAVNAGDSTKTTINNAAPAEGGN